VTTTDPASLIRCSGLVKTYGDGEGAVHALRGVDLTIGRGETVAIVGPSGSGKSTLLQILGCLDRPSGGGYVLDGTDVLDLDDDGLSVVRGRKIGFVFQAFHLFQRLSLVDNVALPLFYQGVKLDARRAAARAALATVRLAHREEHRPHQLSGGEKQRGAIARAIVHRPPLILADEPTGNLDSGVKGEILAFLSELNRDLGVTVVLVTHDDATAAWARRVVRFADGRIQSDATARPALEGPA
jgi:putative ABC transport system ATP-binding protein